MKFPALFLDRDGVINKDFGHVYKIEDIEFIDGIFELVRFANKQKYKVIIITNQSGIGRGFYSKREFLILMDWINKKFLENNCTIDKFYYCPYHPKFGKGRYLKDSNLRKPKPGMIFKANKELDNDLKNSVLVGDKITDVSAGLSAGLNKVIYFSNKKTSKKVFSVSKLSAVKKLNK